MKSEQKIEERLRERERELAREMDWWSGLGFEDKKEWRADHQKIKGMLEIVIAELKWVLGA